MHLLVDSTGLKLYGAAVRGSRTSAREPTANIPWPTSAWPPYRCSSPRARPSWIISASLRPATAARTARPCSASAAFPPTTTSATCSIRWRPITSFRRSPRRLRRSSAPAGSGPSSGSAHTRRLRWTAPRTTAPPRSTVGTAPPAPEKASRPSPSTPCCAPPSWPRAVPRWSRSSRRSSGRKTVTTSRTVRAAPRDGHKKRGGESGAVRRWLRGTGPRYKRLNPIYLGDDLHACQPVCEAVLEQGGHFLFTCKPASHQTIQEYLTGIEPEEHVEQVKRGRERATVRYRWLCGVPLRGDEEALTVNWLMVEILNAKGEVTYRNSFITDLPVTRATVAELAACGRARWKIENESFNVLKNRGYHLEHNFGHGKEHLAALLACFNLVAFAIHTVCDLASGAWRHARETLGPRTRFFHNLQALSTYVVFSSWTELLETLAFARPPPRPPG